MSPTVTPAEWARAAGHGSDVMPMPTSPPMAGTYRYNLSRNLETFDFQGGIDLGKRGLLSDNDILVFGALGGAVHADLDYDALANVNFAFDGGQVGGYATYLHGRSLRRHTGQCASDAD